MKAVELLKIFREPLNLMSKNGILLEDYKYVEAYEHFLQMRMYGVKYRAAIAILAKERNVGERTWVCPECGTAHKRDLLAANNILRQGIAELKSACKTREPGRVPVRTRSYSRISRLQA